MTSEHEKWQKLKNNYLKQVEEALGSINHPKAVDVLRDVDEHLETKYAELYPEQQNWENYQNIITQMGPPEEYAELLAESKTPIAKNSSVFNTFLAVVFVIVLMLVGGYLIYNAKKTPAPAAPTAKPFEFEPDERVLGKWVTIDFVEHIDEFDSSRKNWPGALFLLSLEFQNNGQVQWQAENRKPMMLDWTKGKVEPLDERPSFYYLRNIDGQIFLFYEWVSGDVTERGREPAYYVLKQTKDGEMVVPTWFKNDPQVIGYWVSVDFVKNIDDFNPNVQQTTDLFLKTLRFENNGRLWWTISTSKPIGLDWTKGKIRPFDVMPAVYSIKQLNNTDYLFYEYCTLNNNPAGYYVFKQSERPEKAVPTEEISFENDPRVLGQWKSVDLVENIDQFQPDQTSWRGKLFVKSLDFKEGGIVEWCLGEDQMKTNHRWTKGKLLDDDLNAQYIIKTYNNNDFLFIEWNSGDVTIRGQKPAYYVLKRGAGNTELNIPKPSTKFCD